MVKRLDQICPGETGIVTKVHGAGTVKRRIVDMGLVAGIRIQVKKILPENQWGLRLQCRKFVEVSGLNNNTIL